MLTDRLHKSAFKLHVDILHSMVVLVEGGRIVAPLGEPGKDNRQFVREFVAGLLASSFPHLTPYVCGGGPYPRLWCPVYGVPVCHVLSLLLFSGARALLVPRPLPLRHSCG